METHNDNTDDDYDANTQDGDMEATQIMTDTHQPNPQIALLQQFAEDPGSMGESTLVVTANKTPIFVFFEDTTVTFGRPGTMNADVALPISMGTCGSMSRVAFNVRYDQTNGEAYVQSSNAGKSMSIERGTGMRPFSKGGQPEHITTETKMRYSDSKTQFLIQFVRPPTWHEELRLASIAREERAKQEEKRQTDSLRAQMIATTEYMMTVMGLFRKAMETGQSIAELHSSRGTYARDLERCVATLVARPPPWQIPEKRNRSPPSASSAPPGPPAKRHRGERGEERSKSPAPQTQKTPTYQAASDQPKRKNYEDTERRRFLQLREGAIKAKQLLQRHGNKNQNLKQNKQANRTLQQARNTKCYYGLECTDRGKCLFSHPEPNRNLYALTNVHARLVKWRHVPNRKSYGFIDVDNSRTYCSRKSMTASPPNVPCSVIVGHFRKPSNTGTDKFPVALDVRTVEMAE